VVLARGLYTVGNGETAAVLRWGRLVGDAVGPGLHLRLPAGVDEVRRVRTGEVQRLEVAGDFAPGLDLLTGDENLIEASLVVQYRVARLGHYLFATEDPSLLLSQAVRAALVEAVAAVPVDEVLTTGKVGVQNRVREAAQASLDRYASGVALVAVSLQSVSPPGEAGEAFRRVGDARAESAQAVNRAEAQRERSLRLARGEAGQILAQAEAAAGGRRAQARGAAERFLQLLARQRRAPAQARADLRSEAAARILPRARLVLLAPGERPRIDVHLVEGGVRVPAATAPTAATRPPPRDR
jgi:membrane protease subunit HflK